MTVTATVDAREPAPGRAQALRDDVQQWLYVTSTGKSAAGKGRAELAAWFASLPDDEETRGKVSAIETLVPAPANVPPSHRVEHYEQRKATQVRLLPLDGTAILAEGGSAVTAVDGGDPSMGELV